MKAFIIYLAKNNPYRNQHAEYLFIFRYDNMYRLFRYSNIERALRTGEFITCVILFNAVVITVGSDGNFAIAVDD